MKAKTKTELESERQIRSLIKLMSERGILVRREKLSRGYSYRVKSGKCQLTGKELLFVDRRLPLEQQLSLLHEGLDDIRGLDEVRPEGIAGPIEESGLADDLGCSQPESAKDPVPLGV